MDFLKRIVARLPGGLQSELKRVYFRREIAAGRFVTNEPEYQILEEFVRPGDWVVDIGANVGHYTKKLSELVGESGRVIAFEPVPTTLALLIANTELFDHNNVTVIGTAVSDKLDIRGISMGSFSSGLTNYYEARLSTQADSDQTVLTISLDSLVVDQRIALVKIDTEGHEAYVLQGMRRLIEKSRPVLIIETGNAELINSVSQYGYTAERLRKSPNVLFRPTNQ
ncbi:FkbM family methyltransferase [Lentisalinibacter sediminis]|uniref:FkbM family methyltransferase n=1 Tax=Lentisalinibacter sediminis TaxID=2992237 RepID=UPI00386E8BF7